MTTIAWSLIFVGAALVLVLGYLLIQRIAGQLRVMRDSIRTVESNMDFTHRIDIDTQDELGSTARAFNRLVSKLQESFSGALGDCRNGSGFCRCAEQYGVQGGEQCRVAK